MKTRANYAKSRRATAPTPWWPRQRRARGQSIIIVSLCLFVLIGMVGLAVDGGSLYLQRRIAQKAADTSALAGTHTMLDAFEDNQWGTPGDVTDGTAANEADILDDIKTVAAANGALTSTLQAYFVNDNNQYISTVPVGSFNSVPWSLGAKGIAVKAEAQASSFFMRLFGYNTVTASSLSTAFMGPTVGVGTDNGLFPVGFFTDTIGFSNMLPGNTYTLMEGDSRRGSGNWGYLNFSADTASGGAPPTAAWLDCGYLPWITTQAQWDSWCGRHAGVSHVVGPTQYYTGWPSPTGGPYTAEDLRAGVQEAGWWISANTGTTLSNCDDLHDIVTDALYHDPPDFRLPVIDATNSAGGSNQLMHMLNFAWFRITEADVQCHVTVCDETGCQDTKHWRITGTYLQKQDNSAPAIHGDLLHASTHGVFLEP